MSVVASPTQQGVTKSPTAAHLRTNVINGKVRIASQTNTTGGQGAVYHLVGGTITSNVNLSLPNITTDDTIATQGDNINWTGVHNFSQGLNSDGPITTASSITAGSVSTSSLTTTNSIVSSGSLQVGTDILAFGNTNTVGDLTVGNDASIGGNATVTGNHGVTGLLTVSGAGTSSVASTFNVGGTSDITGTLTAHSTISALSAVTVGGLHTIQSTGNLIHQGTQMQLQPTTASYGSTGHIFAVNQTGGNDASWFGVQVGSSHGLITGTSTIQRIAFWNVAGFGQGTGGAKTISSSYGATEQSALTIAYGTLRNLGLIS